jgi:hypothetical protein
VTRWYPNIGNPPQNVPGAPDDAPPLTQVYVRLRCGKEPAEPWPVTRRVHSAPATRWTFGMRDCDFDITHWRPA